MDLSCRVMHDRGLHGREEILFYKTDYECNPTEWNSRVEEKNTAMWRAKIRRDNNNSPELRKQWSVWITIGR